jgi:hypothetical protein
MTRVRLLDETVETYYIYNVCKFKPVTFVTGGPGSVVGRATAYGLDGRGTESRGEGGDIFRTSPDRPWGPPSLLYNGYRVFPGGKVRPGREADPSPPSSAEVKNGVELYPYSP